MQANNYQEFIEMIQAEGLESIGLFYGSYKGEVVSNEDPENVGRLKIKCPATYGDEAFADWVFPKGMPAGLGSGVLWLPPAQSPIYVCFEKGDPRFPLWEYGWWLRDQTIEGHSPKVHAFVTPYGHRIELNDDEKFVDITNKEGFHVKLVADGIFFGKDGAKNLGKLLDDLFDLFSKTTVATELGPSPFNNKVAYSQLAQNIKDFLKSS